MPALTWTNPIVERHALYPSFGSTLLGVAQRDYPHTRFFNPLIECLDMDSYEAGRGGDPQPTMDAVIGVSDEEHISSERLLLAELKLGVKSVANVKAKNCCQKVGHTRALLGGDSPVYKSELFIFPDRLKHQLKNRFREMCAECSRLRSSQFVTLSAFYSIVKDSNP